MSEEARRCGSGTRKAAEKIEYVWNKTNGQATTEKCVLKRN